MLRMCDTVTACLRIQEKALHPHLWGGGVDKFSVEWEVIRGLEGGFMSCTVTGPACAELTMRPSWSLLIICEQPSSAPLSICRLGLACLAIIRDPKAAHPGPGE